MLQVKPLWKGTTCYAQDDEYLGVDCHVRLCAGGFFWYSGTLSQTIDELNDTYDQTQMRLTQLQGDQADLKTQLETVGTDAFIENQARTMYGYMMPDEIRFVITNPEALYGEDEIPSR